MARLSGVFEGKGVGLQDIGWLILVAEDGQLNGFQHLSVDGIENPMFLGSLMQFEYRLIGLPEHRELHPPRDQHWEP